MNMRNPRCGSRQLCPGRLLLVLLLLATAALPAAARDWRIADFHSTIAIDEQGGTVVTEKIQVVFSGQYNGIYRSIPVDYPGPNRTNYRLILDVTKVTDGDGAPLRYESRKDGPYRKLKIYVPGAVDTTRTVIIEYRMPNAMRYFDDHDEFYWNVTGNDWPVPIDSASALISLPANTAGSLRAQAFTGVYGSTEREASVRVDGSHVTVETNNPLPMRGGLTADIYIPKGLIQEPSQFTRFLWFVRGNVIVLLPIWSLAVMFPMWWFKGRDPDPGMSVAPMYEPPKGMSPAEAGTLIDDGVAPRDITSTLVDLAVRGYLKIEQVQDHVLMFKHTDYIFHLLKPMAEWGDLAPFERVMMSHIFDGEAGETTNLSSLKNHFYTAIPVIKNNLISSLRTKGMYWVDPDSAHAYLLLGALISAGPFILAEWSHRVNLFESGLPTVISIAMATAIIILFGRQMTCKTLAGARTMVQIRGFQEFMNRVDADRLKRMPPDTFEKYLPYAMALGVEHRWAQAFAGIVQNPPSWYVGPNVGGFNPVFFTNSMHSMASAAQDTFVSAPRASSSGSGFGSGGGGGGGFSGGGFGGGGGGAF